MAERRRVEIAGRTIVLIDSVTEVAPADTGHIVVTGSHGGLSSAGYARAVRAALYVFNDAGIGKHEAGVAALAVLDAAGIPACTVGHATARIGDAADALDHGVVTRANAPAAAAGFRPGVALRSAVAHDPIV